MPPRYAYWTILIDGKATAFRAKESEELLPTLNQLRRKNDDVALRYFSRGKLWDSPEQAEWAAKSAGGYGEKRGDDCRPGATHKDTRARFDKKRKGTKPAGDKPAAAGSRGTGASSPGEHRDERRGPAKPFTSDRGEARPLPKPRNEGDRPWSGKPREQDRRAPSNEGRSDSRRPWTPKPRAENERPWKPKPRAEGERPWTKPRAENERPWTK